MLTVLAVSMNEVNLAKPERLLLPAQARTMDGGAPTQRKEQEFLGALPLSGSRAAPWWGEGAKPLLAPQAVMP